MAVPVLRASKSSEQIEAFPAPMVLSRAWLTRLAGITNPENLRFFNVFDDGMQPTFARGDVLLVDVGVREAAQDGVHLLQAHGRTHVRRLRIRIDGSAELSEDSPTSRTVETLAVATLKITARVVWVWAGRPI